MREGKREAGKEQGGSRRPRGQESKEGAAASFIVGQAYLAAARELWGGV